MVLGCDFVHFENRLFRPPGGIAFRQETADPVVLGIRDRMINVNKGRVREFIEYVELQPVEGSGLRVPMGEKAFEGSAPRLKNKKASLESP